MAGIVGSVYRPTLQYSVVSKSTLQWRKMLLADIGNTHFHIFDGQSVEHLSYVNAIEKYRGKSLRYISVNRDIEKQIGSIEGWKNVSDLVHIPGEYDTMGVDRKALCLSHDNGIFIDAGSAITVDVVEEGMYKGGYILPGIAMLLESYGRISPALETALAADIDLTQLPLTTKEQISYGIIASIKALIDRHSSGKTLYFTGGDGEFLSGFFDHVLYSETLVFEGMRYVLKEKRQC